jgi:DNA polymerase-3 subunit alpha
LDINDLQQAFIQQLNQLFIENKGENTVSFEILEQETIKKIQPVVVPKSLNEEEASSETEHVEDVEIELPEIEEENQIITRLSVPSRKLKIKISNELLVELEKMNIKFSLN